MKDLSARVEKLEKQVAHLIECDAHREMELHCLKGKIEVPKLGTTPKYRESRENEAECVHDYIAHLNGVYICRKCEALYSSPTKESCDHQWRLDVNGKTCGNCGLRSEVDTPKESKTLAQKLYLHTKPVGNLNDMGIIWREFEDIAKEHYREKFDEYMKASPGWHSRDGLRTALFGGEEGLLK